MATHGIKQLSSLTIKYCGLGGSSRYIRPFLTSDAFKQFAQENPTVTINIIKRNNRHPFLLAQYVKGWDKQICVKNEQDESIMKQIMNLNNSSGRKLKRFKKPVITKQVSVQGVWTPQLKIVDEDWSANMSEVSIVGFAEGEMNEIHEKNRTIGRGQFNKFVIE